MPLAPGYAPHVDAEPQYERQVPPYTGFGSEEDSLTSCVGSLVQTAPKKIPGQDRTLRYLGRLKSPQPEDQGREFVLQYVCRVSRVTRSRSSTHDIHRHLVVVSLDSSAQTTPSPSESRRSATAASSAVTFSSEG